MVADAATTPPTINGVALHSSHVRLDRASLLQRGRIELLRQAAQRAGLLDIADAPGDDGIPSRAASEAIERLLERELRIPTPTADDCRRHFDAHSERYAHGERVHARHILFAVTPGVDVVALRRRAEACLLDLRAADGAHGDAFAAAAREWSNCPSGGEGGDLGWLRPEECAPEFARAVFGTRQIGVLANLVHTRHGLHIVEVLARVPGVQPAFEEVMGRVANDLHQQAFVAALRQYLSLLAKTAIVEGLDFE